MNTSTSSTSNIDSNSTVCPPGFADDIYSFPPRPCGINLRLHVALCVIWSVWELLIVVEVIVSRVFHKNPKNLGKFLSDLAIVLWMVSGIALFSTMASNITNTNIPGAFNFLIWFVSGNLLNYIAINAINTSAPLVTKLHQHNFGSDLVHKEAWFFNAVKIFDIVATLIYQIEAFLVLVVVFNVPGVIDGPVEALKLGEATFAILGVCLTLELIGFIAIYERVRKIAVELIKFQEGLPGFDRNSNQTAPLEVLARGMRFTSIVTAVFGILFCAIFLLMGADLIPLSWVSIHIIFGGLSVSVMTLFRLSTRDSIIFIIPLGFKADSTADSSVKSPIASSSGDEPNKNRLSLRHSSSGLINSQPSPILENINIHDLAVLAANT